jgi:hypothetical protein
MGLGWLKPSIESLLDEAELLDLSACVEPMAAVAALGLHEPIALFPVSDRRGRDVEHALDGANAVDREIALLHDDQLTSSALSMPGNFSSVFFKYLIKYLIIPAIVHQNCAKVGQRDET